MFRRIPSLRATRTPSPSLRGFAETVAIHSCLSADRTPYITGLPRAKALAMTMAILALLLCNTISIAHAADLKDNEVEPADQICTIEAHQTDKVQVVEETAVIPVTVVNTCEEDVKITLQAQSLSPNVLKVRGDNDGFIDATISADSSLPISVPITAIANGEMDLQITVLYEGRNLSQWTINITSTREIGAVVTWIFYIFIAFLIIAGVIRTIRRIINKIKK